MAIFVADMNSTSKDQQQNYSLATPTGNVCYTVQIHHACMRIIYIYIHVNMIICRPHYMQFGVKSLVKIRCSYSEFQDLSWKFS